MNTHKKLTVDLVGLSARLEALRSATGLEKGEFADSIEVDRSSYSKIIKGEKPLHHDMAFRCAERWGVSMDYLYRGILLDLPDKYDKQIRTALSAATE